MKKIAFAILLTMIFCACGRGKYYITSAFRHGVPNSMAELVLDSSYRFYLREVYKDKNVLNENVLKTNVEKSDTANKIRIEVEYLLLSWQHKNAIYISTIPDKFQHYYSANRLDDTLINAYDFSTFHFGKIDKEGESISFISKDGRKSILWDLRPFIAGTYPQKIHLREIAVQKNDVLENVILINKALEEPVTFTRQKRFVIVFEKPGTKQQDGADSNRLCRLFDDKIYFDQYHQGFDIYFRFDNHVSDSKDSAIKFDYKRARYSPLLLVQKGN